MRRFALVVVCAFGLSACDPAGVLPTLKADIAALEAKVITLVSMIKAKVPVVEADIAEGVQITCNVLIPDVINGIGAFQNVLAQTNIKVSSNVTTNLNKANSYASTGAAGCASYQNTVAAAPANQPAPVTQAVAAVNAYTAARSSLAAAQTAAAKNQ